jgi:hypothetical protein
MTETAIEAVFHLKLTGEGLTIDKQIDAGLAAAIAQMTLGGVAPGASAPGVSRQPTATPVMQDGQGQRVSLREYLQSIGAGRGIHIKILAVGRYLRDFERQDDFSREEVRVRFRSAGEPQPANFARDFQKAVRAGWIAEDHQNAGRFYVTRTGDEEINGRLNRNGPTSIPRSRTRRTRRARDDGDAE